MIERTFKLCLNAGTGSAPFINVSQTDKDEVWLFELYTETGERYIPSSGAIIGIKADGHGIANNGTVDSEGRVVITETEQMTATAGRAIFELSIDGLTHGTANFIVNVEKKPIDGAIMSDTDLSLIQEAIDAASEIEELLDGETLDEKLLPIVQAETSDWLTDHITNPSNPPIDTSLTVAGAAADAKSTGDEITDLKSAISTINDEILSVKNLEQYNTAFAVTSGVTIPFTQIIFDVPIQQDRYYSFTLQYSGTAVYALYADGVRVLTNLAPNKKYIFYADTSINSISIYTSPDATDTAECVLEVFDYESESGVDYINKQVNALVDKNIIIPFILLAGYYNTAGEIAHTTNEELHTNRLEVSPGSDIYINLQYDDPANVVFLDYFAWDSEGVNIGRTHIVNLTETGGYSGVLTVPNGVGYISFAFRAYDGATFELWQEWDVLGGENSVSTEMLQNGCVTAVKLANDVDGKIMDTVHLNQPSNVVRTIAHRGDDVYAPQCTAPSYIIARKHGLSIAENDLWLSEDGEFVMWHDTTLNKLGNMVDINGYLMYTDGTDYYWVNDSTVYTWNGTTYVASEVPLSGLTRCVGANYAVNSQGGAIGLPLSVLKRIDFGVYKGQEFAGTQILTFEEWIILCKQLGMEVYVDKKMSYTNDMLTSVANIVKKCGMSKYTSWLGIYSIPQINLLRSIIPDARVGILRHPSAEDIATYTSVNTGRGFFFNGDGKTMSAESIQLGLNAGFDVEVWYVDVLNVSEADQFNVIRNAVSYGVTGISLDHYRVDEAFKYMLEQY